LRVAAVCKDIIIIIMLLMSRHVLAGTEGLLTIPKSVRKNRQHSQIPGA